MAGLRCGSRPFSSAHGIPRLVAAELVGMGSCARDVRSTSAGTEPAICEPHDSAFTRRRSAIRAFEVDRRAQQANDRTCVVLRSHFFHSRPLRRGVYTADM